MNTSSSVDPKEILHFKSLIPIWWNKNSGMGLLHYMNQLRVPLVLEGLVNTGVVKKELVDSPKPLQDISVLEVGCGGGIYTEGLAKLGCTITGIDVAPELIELATYHSKLDSSLSNIHYILDSVEEHAENNYEKYDAVVASEVIEHIDNRKGFLEACVKCLKPGGSIFITTFNKTTASWLLGIIFAEYISGLIPRGTHDWYKFISPEDVGKMLEDYNCHTKMVRGMSFNLFNNTWRWTRNTSVNYALHAVKN